MKKYNYVYKLKIDKPIDEKEYYIGCRSCNCDPNDDIYWSSSKEIKRLINDGFTFKKDILKVFDNREDAITYEIRLHNDFDVSHNPNFFNKSKQSSKGFDTSGIIFINGKPIKLKDYYNNSDLKYHSFGKISVKDSNNKYYSVDITDERYINGELTNITNGKMPICIDNGFKLIETSEYYSNKSKYKPTNKNKVPVIDKDGNKFLIDKKDDRYINGDVKSVHTGKIIAKDNNGNITYVSKENFKKLNLLGINKGNINGSDNPNAKRINIYDKECKLIFECNGDFKKICKDNNLPFVSLYRSYKNNGKLIYNTERGIKDATKRGFIDYIGWYAKIV